MIRHQAADLIPIVLHKFQVAYHKACGLLTGFGLDLLAGTLSGPTVDRATLQLVGVLFASIILPGLAWAFALMNVAGLEQRVKVERKHQNKR
eukprot:3373318-Amphidinium_carterae.1